MPKIVSQQLAPPELLNNLVCFYEDLCSDDCVRGTNEQPCTQACNARADRICENVSQSSQLLQQKILFNE